MLRYLIRRTLFLILVLWIISVLTFLIFVKLPAGDPARRAAGRRTNERIIAQARKNLGLDKPVIVQYARFAKGLIPWPGLFLNRQVYFSYSNYVPVKEELYQRLPITITLTVGAAVLWLLVGLPIGIISAVKPRSIADRASMIFALFGVSAPVFWLGLVLLYVFWFQLGWAAGSGIPAGETLWQAILKGRFILPWVALSLAFAAFYTRMVRGNLMEVLSEDYIRTARAKGLSERRVIFRHGLRSALTPVVTMFGMDVGLLLGGAIITETVFNLPGLGRYAIQGIRGSDFPAVMGVTVLGTFFIIVANLVVDVLYAFVDPRIQLS
ncbi:MAG: ABC transporter permease [Actinobacteria bacterium]|nr:ABC transporter permease [Actinomycetota bacterium]